ncbi:nucleotidyltransferase domain-containing protein [Bordetella sp. N]|uniref:nucleotidyltransferase domain-containing protein n=1 Tax=Bordetella sp. N TaxID=1746199 RepID=UPI00070DD0A8|nr:nucleotidyltransferase domain-containing protein [Bordetella sp. N]ALM85823.1 transcriptional regulator [Bordetella sp. N]
MNASHISLSDALFSGTKQRVLGLLFGQPTRSFYTNEIVGLTGSGNGAVQRELTALASSGLVSIERIGNQMHYSANSESPIYSELCAIVAKTVGLAEPLRNALHSLKPQIAAAFVYGSVAKNADTASSDIDLMLISDDINYGDVFLLLEDVSGQLGRPVNPTILTRAEFSRRIAANDSFMTRVMAQPKTWIIGSSSDLDI